MNVALRIRRVQVFPLAIPMRFRFEHAAAGRDVADPVVLQLEATAPFADCVGYGETLARRYVTGETTATVVADIAGVFAERLLDFRPSTFTEALEFLDSLPFEQGGRPVLAARTALELAILDLAGHVFRRRAADIAGWVGAPGFGTPGALAAARYSGIVVGRGDRKLGWLLRAQRCYGLRDFKLKVALPGWEARLETAQRVLHRALGSGRATLRADANGGWSADEALAAAPRLVRCGVSALEQPLPPAEDARLPELSRATGIDLIADESVRTLADARRLIAAGGVRVLNIRIAKHGGLIPALNIARATLTAGLDVQLGCLVGETSILSAAGIAFLEVCPRVRFVEGAYAPFLLRGDVTSGVVRFGRGGRVRARAGWGLGVAVDPARLRALAIDGPRSLAL